MNFISQEILEDIIPTEGILQVVEKSLSDSDDEKDNNYKENIDTSDNAAHLVDENIDVWQNSEIEIFKLDKNIPAKRNTSSYEKDKLKLLSENQRLIRENGVVEFKYKPKQCQTVREFTNMLKERRNNKVTPQVDEAPETEIQESTKDILSQVTETRESLADDEGGDILPLRARIGLDPEIGRKFDKRNAKKQVLSKIELLLKEKYKNVRGGLIELKSSNEYRADMKQSDLFLERLKNNLMPTNPLQRQDVDFVVKVMFGEIDPILSKDVDVLLSEEERKQWCSMSNRDKWKKHRSLLLAAEMEKHRAVREERLNQVKCENERQEKDQAAKGDVLNDGLSDDDYEWKEEDDNDGSSDGSETDRVSASCEDEDELEGPSISRSKGRAKIISDDEEDENKDESVHPVDDIVVTSNFDPGFMKEFFDDGLHFFDVPNSSNSSAVDIFADSRTMDNLNGSMLSDGLNESLVSCVANDGCDTIDATVPLTSSISEHRTVLDQSAATVILEGTGTDLSLTATLPNTIPIDCSTSSDASAQLHSMRRKLFQCSPLAPPQLESQETLATRTFETLKMLFGEPDQSSTEKTSDDKVETSMLSRNAVDIDKDIDDVDLGDSEDGDGLVDLDRDNVVESIVADSTDQLGLFSDEDDVGGARDDDDRIETSDDDDESDGEDNSDVQEEEEDSVEEDEEELLRKQVVANGSNRFVPREYFEDEAELSGSDAEEFGPDEDETGLDIFEDEEGDKEDLPSEGRLRRQIEKIHNRLEIDRDAQDVRYLKELYLEDGDLHLEGDGRRTKRFTWAGMNDGDESYDLSQHPHGYGNDQDGDATDFVELDGEVEDPSMDNEEDKQTSVLLEKYGQFLDNSPWTASSTDRSTQLAWQTEDKIDMFSSKGPTRKYGSFMNKTDFNWAPTVPGPVPNTESVSLKTRMQKHAFVVQDRPDVAKMMNKRSSESINEGPIFKKNKFDSSSDMR